MLSIDWVGENVVKYHEIIQHAHQMSTRCLPTIPPSPSPRRIFVDFRFGYIKSHLRPRSVPSYGELKHFVWTSDLATSNRQELDLLMENFAETLTLPEGYRLVFCLRLRHMLSL